MASMEISNSLFFANIKDIIDSGNSVELKVKGTSMHPTLWDGKHKVVLIPYQKADLKVGSIALFIYNKKYILHRLVSIRGNQLTFQGDNLPYVKECVKEEDIIAIVEFIIPPTGKVIDCKKQRFLFKSKFWRPLHLYYLRLTGIVRGLLFKIFLHKN